MRNLDPLRSLLLAACCFLAASTATAQPRNVLVIFSNNRLLPANIEVDRGLREVIAKTTKPAGRNIELFGEFLDLPAFSGQAYEQTVTTYLREKYASRRPEVIVVAGQYAFEFVLRHRARLFAEAPVVYAAVDSAFLRTLRPLPAGVVGVPFDYDYAGTIQQALIWHPRAQRLVLVTGASQRDHEWEADVRAALARVEAAPQAEFVSGLPTEAVLTRLRGLGEGDVVFTPGYFRDGADRAFAPVESAGVMASASGAPLYGPYSTFIGSGAVGGRMPTFVEAGRQAARNVADLLDGVPPAALRLPASIPAQVQVDWRQVRKWGIDEAAIPPDAIVYFREPTFWETYRSQALIVTAVILLQAALIAALLVERRLRRRAALQAAKDRAALTRMTRVSMMGQLSASIAHQLNQPLAAILGNAEAARKMLDREPLDLAEMRDICDDIISADNRAAEVIRRLSALFKRGEMKVAPLDLNELVSETLDLVRTELASRHVVPLMELAPSLPAIDGGRVDLQQVLLNLILNAADAMSEAAERTLTVRTEHAGENVRLCVVDRGAGIAPEDVANVFEAFWTSKPGGTGIGLAICQSIVTAHRGTLTVASNPGGGATFCATLPVRQKA